MMVILEPKVQGVDYHRPPSGARAETIDLAVIRATLGRGPTPAPPQRPRFDLILFVDAGATTHVVDFEAHAVGAGDALWVRAGQVQRWGDLRGVRGSCLLFQPEALSPATVELVRGTDVARRSHWPSAEVPTDVRALVAMLPDLGTTPQDIAAAERLAEVVTLRLATTAPQPRGRQASLHEAFVRSLDGHDFSHRSVSAFARALGCTPKTLTLAVRARSGRAAKQLIDERVALEARRCLAFDASATVASIAFRLGFDDAANFSKHFVRQVGMTPGAFRASLAEPRAMDEPRTR